MGAFGAGYTLGVVASSPRPPQSADRPAGGKPERLGAPPERLGPVELGRHVKDDGRALILYDHIRDEQADVSARR
jgi:hypothetical protein